MSPFKQGCCYALTLKETADLQNFTRIFIEPSSWTDEYKRVLKLFETTLKK